MIKAITLITIVLLGCTGIIFGQDAASDLQQRLTAKQSPLAVMAEVDAVYQGRTEVEGLPKYKHWARWAHTWCRYVQPDGTFGDPRALIREAAAAWPANTGQRNSNNLWSQIGPVNSTYANNGSFCAGNGYGRIDRIAFHPTDPSTIYVGAPYGGLWMTDDGGASWSCLTDALPGIGVGGIVIDHQDPDRIYVLSGTGDDQLGWLVDDNGYFNTSDGIYMSNDQGATWEEVYVFPQITRARRMKQHPSDADVLFALTDIGVYRTTDGGMWWDTVITGDFVDIEFHPTDHDTLYISGYADFRYSQDAGTTWDTTLLAGTDPLRAPNFCGGRIEIAVSPAAPDNVWLLAGPGMPPNQYCGLYVSASSADTFTLIDTGPFNVLGNPGSTSDQSTYDIAIAVSPNNGNTILAGGLVVWRTGNGAANWTVTAPYWETTGGQQSTLPTNYVHPDIHDLAYNLLDNKVYCASDGGIYVSVNGGFSWTNISQGIITSQIYHINGSLLSTGRLPIGLQDNGVKMRVSGTSGDFQHINSGDGYEVVTDPTNSDIVAATLNDTCFIYNTYSTTSRTGAPTGPGFFKPLRYKPGDGNTLYFGDPALTVYTISTNSTSTLNDGSSASWTIETCEDVVSRIYFAGGANGFQNDPNGSFYTSFDSGASSFDRSGVAGFPSELQIITDIAVYPGQCHKVAFSMGGFFAGSKVYYSENSGATLWQNISYNLPNVPVFSLAIDADGSFYAGTEIGVFVKSETGTEWAPYYNGLPRVPISGLVVQQSVNKLIASTFGRGVWETFLASGCPVSSLVTNPLKGQWVQSADIQVTSTSTVTGGAGTDVRFTAGERVILMPGFQVATGNRFIADLDGCVE